MRSELVAEREVNERDKSPCDKGSVIDWRAMKILTESSQRCLFCAVESSFIVVTADGCRD